MAELNIPNNRGCKKGKKLSTHIDLTPMVDLGFLLITFFIYTTTMSKPKTMEINMPYNDPDIQINTPTEIKKSLALTIILSNNHSIFYYEGIGDDPHSPLTLKETTFKSSGGIRDVIIAKKNMVSHLQQLGKLAPTDKATVLIKPDYTSTYDDLVNILDEMNIDAIETYVVVDITSAEREIISIKQNQ